jgi:hypothetical protein
MHYLAEPSDLSNIRSVTNPIYQVWIGKAELDPIQSANMSTDRIKRNWMQHMLELWWFLGRLRRWALAACDHYGLRCAGVEARLYVCNASFIQKKTYLALGLRQMHVEEEMC